MRVAIVGGGPRGLGAVEALAEAHDQADVTVFEPHSAPGAGPVYDPGQCALNLLNLPLRAVDLGSGALGVAFADWIGADADPDGFPPRATLGRYLCARFSAVAERSGVAVVPAAATGLARDGGWRVAAGGVSHGPFDAVLLAVGHQPVDDDPQLAAWRAHAAEVRGATLAPAYPAEALSGLMARHAGRVVGIRGFGLSMLDVVRALSEGAGGAFEDAGDGALRYRATGREPRLAPFSLDGMPPAPKPSSAAIDARFDLTAAERDAAVSTLRMLCADADAGPFFATLARIAGRRGPGEGACRAWLAREFEDAAPQPRETVGARALIDDYLAMAEGRRAPSAGYALGQAMRKLQPELRAVGRPRTPEAARRLLAIDEGMKRYSFGPPVAAIRRLVALMDAGVVTLRQLGDPDVALHDAGWRLQDDDEADVATAMIDSVLPAPDPARIASPLVTGLLAGGLARPWGEGLGLDVDGAGGLVGADGRPTPGLSALGRLTIGRRVGTDSIHDCFGPAAADWARALVRDAAR